MSEEIEALRARILEADETGADPFEAVVKLMAVDKVFDIGISALIKTTIDIVKHDQRRTAVMDTIRYEAIAA